MAIYRYSDPSLIESAQIHFAPNHGPVAILIASEQATPEQLGVIRDAISQQGWSGGGVKLDDGRYAFQVSGFNKPDQLEAFFEKHRFTTGKPEVTAEKSDNVKAGGLREWLARNSLTIAGWLNLLGDMTLLGSGIKGKRPIETAAGGLYTVGGAVLARYGNVKRDYAVDTVKVNLAEFYVKETGEAPQQEELAHALANRPKGPLAQAENYLARYPSQVTLGAYTGGAALMLASGINKGLKGQGWTGAAYGANSTALKIASMLIKEDPDAGKDDPNRNFIQRFADWIRQKPLRLFGFGSLVSEVLLAKDAINEYRHDPKQKSYILKGITTGAYMAADFLVAISNKDQTNAAGKFTFFEQRQIEVMSAEENLHTPEAERVGRRKRVSELLKKQHGIQGDATAIEASLEEQEKQLKENPWTMRITRDIAAEPARG